MMNNFDVTSIVAVVVAVVSGVFTVIAKYKDTQARKTRDVAVQENESLRQEKTSLIEYFNVFTKDVLDYIKIAEESKMTGVAKKTYVKSLLITLFSKKNIDYEEEKVDEFIERIISLSKIVNFKGEIANGTTNQGTAGTSQIPYR